MRIKECLAFVAIIMTVTALHAAEPIGRIIALEGSASVVGEDGQKRVLELKSPIYLNDRIITADGSKIQVSFNDDSIISQGEKSEMLVDEYVFSATKKDDNSCSVKMMKGMFRVITGKITKINPERFRVRTKMATIGIRGCDVGFVITETSANVYVIQLSGQESITVTARDNVGGGEWDGLVAGKWEDPEVAKQHLLNVTKPNRIVSVTQGAGTPSERVLTSTELSTLISAVTPDQAPGTTGQTPPGGGTQGAADAPAGTGTDAGGDTTLNPVAGLPVSPDPNGGTEPVLPLIDSQQMISGVDASISTFGNNTIVPLPSDSTVNNAEQQASAEAESGTTGDAGTTPVDNPMLVDPNAVDTTTTTDSGTGASTPVDTGGTTTPPATTPVVTYTELGASAVGDWTWGKWETDGLLTKVDIKNQNNILSAVDCAAILAGSTTYNLSGSGTAGALLKEGGVKALVQGGCTLYVTMGGQVLPNWDGSFNMANGSGSSLNFLANGSVGADGKLNADSLPSFSMKVNSTTYTAASIDYFNALLHGPPGAVKPTGASGRFGFTTSGATAAGAFGADLN